MSKIRRTIYIGERVAKVLLTLEAIGKPVTFKEYMYLLPTSEKYSNKEAIKRMWISGLLKIHNKKIVLSDKALDLLKEIHHPENIIDRVTWRWKIRICHS